MAIDFLFDINDIGNRTFNLRNSILFFENHEFHCGQCSFATNKNCCATLEKSPFLQKMQPNVRLIVSFRLMWFVALCITSVAFLTKKTALFHIWRLNKKKHHKSCRKKSYIFNLGLMKIYEAFLRIVPETCSIIQNTLAYERSKWQKMKSAHIKVSHRSLP